MVSLSPIDLAVIDDVGQLTARRRGGVENMLVRERHAGQLQEGEDLEAIAVVVGDAEQGRDRNRASASLHRIGVIQPE